MKAKPKKCVSMAIAPGPTGMVPTDPELTIKVNGEDCRMGFISHRDDPWFKIMGRYLLEDLSESEAKARLLDFFKEAGEKIESTLLPGRFKVWIWDSYVMAKVAWLFLIHDIVPSWVESELQPIQTRWFRKWTGFPKRGTNASIFFRSREHHGLQLKEAVSWHKQCRLTRRHILTQSEDPIVTAIHQGVAEAQRDSASNAWKDCVELEKLEQEAQHRKMRGPLMQAGVGVGWGKAHSRSLSAEKEVRQSILQIFREITEEERITYVITNLKYFGEWVKWSAAMKRDSRWSNVLAYSSDSELKWHLCATEDVLPTPSVRKTWRLKGATGKCPRCGHSHCSLLHILTQCQMQHKVQSPPKWRHDSILLAIAIAVQEVVNRFKKAQQAAKLKPPQATTNACVAFKSAGLLQGGEEGGVAAETELTQTFKAPRAKPTVTLLGGAIDWCTLADLDAPEHGHQPNVTFPMEITVSDQRPDLVIWSKATRTVIWIELTSPWEENMESQHFTKLARYEQLRMDCENNGWRAIPICVEVGCRGYVNPHGWHTMIKTLGFTAREAKKLKWIAEKTAEHCSHTIFALFRNLWVPKPLLNVTAWHQEWSL
jgi:hypothetical protein